MSLLVETIKLKDGILFNMEYHNRRFNRTRSECFGIRIEADLNRLIQIPDDYKLGLYRCRVIYSHEIESIEFHRHTYNEIRTLKMVEDNNIDYSHKYVNRDRLKELYNLREDCDDIIIVKNGCITDSFNANTVFFDGQEWVTPDTPLLRGTKREKLLAQKKIKEKRIKTDDLKKYSMAGLVNALQDFDEMPVIETSKIFL